jgi:glutaredoxin 3
VNERVSSHMPAMAKIEIYTTNWCPYCYTAKALLDEKGVAYDEIDATDPAVRMDMIQRAHGRRTVPQIFIGNRHVGGYDELAALERHGKLDPLLG